MLISILLVVVDRKILDILTTKLEGTKKSTHRFVRTLKIQTVRLIAETYGLVRKRYYRIAAIFTLRVSC